MRLVPHHKIELKLGFTFFRGLSDVSFILYARFLRRANNGPSKSVLSQKAIPVVGLFLL